MIAAGLLVVVFVFVLATVAIADALRRAVDDFRDELDLPRHVRVVPRVQVYDQDAEKELG